MDNHVFSFADKENKFTSSSLENVFREILKIFKTRPQRLGQKVIWTYHQNTEVKGPGNHRKNLRKKK